MDVCLRPSSLAVAAEESLVDAAIAGSVEAFAALYDQHLERVFRHVYYRVGNQADAEDLTQQIFLQAWQAIGRFRRTGAPFIAWLLTIAHNLLVNVRARARQTEPLDLEPASWARWANPEEQTLASHDCAMVRRLILRLKPEQQQVIILRFVDQIDHATIAKALGKTDGHVRVIQHRALVTLRAWLAEEVMA
jgi:RNA polymerase sigma-70 factor (ECF subfamily)